LKNSLKRAAKVDCYQIGDAQPRNSGRRILFNADGLTASLRPMPGFGPVMLLACW
jgi:hypothetical protein